MKTIATLVASFIMGMTFCHGQATKEIYYCTPCDLSCDSLAFTTASDCPHCGMKLLNTKELFDFNNLIVNDIKIEEGAGIFLVEGGSGHQEKVIEVYYYKPKNFTPDSQILMVIPGSGRDGDEYRDSWIEEAEKYNILILSPRYAEKKYDFGGYQMGGLLYDMNLSDCATFIENSNVVKLDEAVLEYKINENAEEWIYNDFDRLFDHVVVSLGSKQKEYDIFGHSAGGQILHRLVIFRQNSKANRILASNSGFYTLPNFDVDLPFGLKNAPVKSVNLKQSFKNKLVLFLGELDNENETGGIALHSPTANKQGLHRFERGKYFYKEGERISEKMNSKFNWELIIIPAVGHDFRKMGDEAAKYLYE